MAYASIFGQSDVGPVSGSAGANADLAFGPMSSNGGSSHPLVPSSGNTFAWAFWLGMAGLATLVLIRRSLPA